MTIELIPVIEIGYNDQSIIAAGLIPYLEGFPFYRLADISVDNLTKLTIDHTRDMREGKYEREQACSFFGGYVLNVDGQDKYFPQCCGDLGDIHYWQNLSNKQNFPNEGHPAPSVTFEKNNIIFDFTVGEFDEHFQPTPPETTLIIDSLALRNAVEKVKEQLIIFQSQLEQINETEHLNIENIGGLLIWGNDKTIS